MVIDTVVRDKKEEVEMQELEKVSGG